MRQRYCDNCVNRHPARMFIMLAGKKTSLCLMCWYGFCKGVSDDFISFLNNPQTAMQSFDPSLPQNKKGRKK